MHACAIRKLTEPGEIQLALAREAIEFRKNEFLDVAEKYAEQIPDSHFFGAFGPDGTCEGMTRIISSGLHLPPFLGEGVVIYDREKWAMLARGGLLDEFATVAVEESGRGLGIFVDLVRVAYRDAKLRGRKYFGIIMEPDRVEAMNAFYHYRYKIVGPPQLYEGEVNSLVAPYVLDFVDQERYLIESGRLDYLQWFVRHPINDPGYPQPTG
ncbi:MAG: hypothetical protein ACHQUB_00045 [Candidatus Saccharimonadia bacterium]